MKNSGNSREHLLLDIMYNDTVVITQLVITFTREFEIMTVTVR